MKEKAYSEDISESTCTYCNLLRDCLDVDHILASAQPSPIGAEIAASS